MATVLEDTQQKVSGINEVLSDSGGVTSIDAENLSTQTIEVPTAGEGQDVFSFINSLTSTEVTVSR